MVEQPRQPSCSWCGKRKPTPTVKCDLGYDLYYHVVCRFEYEEWIAEWVAQSRMAQGLPPKIEDFAVLARVAEILKTVHL